MGSKKVDPWYSIFGGRYIGEHPALYNKDELPWIQTLEKNWEVIRDELLGLVEEDPERLQPYNINRSMSFPPQKWKTMGLIFWNMMNHKNCNRCPKTMAVLKQLPGCTSASLSILEPQSNINPHQGDTDAVIRCHMGLKIPAPLPECGFEVNGNIIGWQEGVALPFCDAQTHTAWNQTDQRRYVMILDVMRPEFQKRKNEVCAHVLASAAIQMLYQDYDFLRRRKRYVKKFIYHVIRIFFLAYLPFQRIPRRG